MIWNLMHYLPDHFIKHNPLISEVCSEIFQGEKTILAIKILKSLVKFWLLRFFCIPVMYSLIGLMLGKRKKILDIPHCFRWIFAFLNCIVCIAFEIRKMYLKMHLGAFTYYVSIFFEIFDPSPSHKQF